jgi:hypothetical protein
MDEHPEKPQARRVNTILDLLVAIRNEKGFYEKAQMIDRLQQAFRRYRWTRGIFFATDGTHEDVTPAKQIVDDDGWEYSVVHVLLIIAGYYPDYLSKIERCTVCRRWMIRRKLDHRFCGGKCRQYEYDHDPERVQQHRANMRRLYQVEKERAERAKRGVVSLGRARNKQKKSLR